MPDDPYRQAYVLLHRAVEAALDSEAGSADEALVQLAGAMGGADAWLAHLLGEPQPEAAVRLAAQKLVDRLKRLQ